MTARETAPATGAATDRDTDHAIDPATRATARDTGLVAGADPLVAWDDGRRATFAGVAGHLIPAAHGMPSAGDVVGDARLRFVLGARPDLAEPLEAALRPDLGHDPAARLAALERDELEHHAALVQAVVFGYYTDRDVRDRLGYPGQQALQLYSWKVPPYIEEGLTDQVLARGPVWRDPATGRRAEASQANEGTGASHGTGQTEGAEPSHGTGPGQGSGASHGTRETT